MTGAFTYKPKRNTFGGLISSADYNTSSPHTLFDIASDILSDMKFDEQCRKNIENRNRSKNNEKQLH